MVRHNEKVQVGFAPWMVAGVRTQWENMRPYVVDHPGIEPHVAEIHPYLPGRLLERLPLVPSSVRGNARSLLCAAALFRPSRLDVLWTHEMRAVLPYVLTKGRRQRVPVVFTTDSTSAQMAAFGDHYAKAATKTLRATVRDAVDTRALCHATVVNPWSEWAARGLVRDHGIPRHKIHVIPPGIDLERWPMVEREHERSERLRLLFVGGDFERKGGAVLLDIFSAQFAGKAELHVVTREPVAPRPGVHIYSDLGPNDPRLSALYAACDIFVLPTYADCFSLASLEAMASGLPVITTTVGGIPEIVADGQSGFLIEPRDGAALAERIRLLLGSSELRTHMGREGRHIVETRFDAARTTAAMLDLLISLARRPDASYQNRMDSSSR